MVEGQLAVCIEEKQKPIAVPIIVLETTTNSGSCNHVQKEFGFGRPIFLFYALKRSPTGHTFCLNG